MGYRQEKKLSAYDFSIYFLFPPHIYTHENDGRMTIKTKSKLLREKKRDQSELLNSAAGQLVQPECVACGAGRLTAAAAASARGREKYEIILPCADERYDRRYTAPPAHQSWSLDDRTGSRSACATTIMKLPQDRRRCLGVVARRVFIDSKFPNIKYVSRSMIGPLGHKTVNCLRQLVRVNDSSDDKLTMFMDRIIVYLYIYKLCSR